MTVKTKREAEEIETNYLQIRIGDTYYNIRETLEGSLTINKVSDKDSRISIFPYMSNQIEII